MGIREDRMMLRTQRIRRTFRRLGTVVCVLLWIGVGEAGAQNFVNLEPMKTVDDKDDVAAIGSGKDLTDDQVLALKSSLEDVEGGEGESSRYTLGVNDVIEIKVMRHPEVSGRYAINKEGKIQYEFVGDIPVAGLTKEEVAELITDKLAEYIIEPDVTVKIVGYNSKVVYVVGEVGRPGKIFMRGDTITVREALMQAGLPLLSGKTKKSRLITPSENGKGKSRLINVYALLYEGDLRENAVMKPGDVLYVPPTLLTSAMRAIAPVAAPVGTAAGTGRTLTTPF